MMLKNKNSLTITVLIVLLVALLVIYVVRSNNDSDQTPATDYIASDKINFGPPTDNEAAAGDLIKPKLVEEEDATDENSHTSNAQVVIVDASQYDNTIEVRSFVSNIIENGSCTITITNESGSTITRTVDAAAEASTTLCQGIEIDRSEFTTPGIWNVLVKFTGSSSSGEASTSMVLN